MDTGLNCSGANFKGLDQHDVSGLILANHELVFEGLRFLE